MNTNNATLPPIVPARIAELLEHGTASLRARYNNPNHHLYRNNGSWWIHFTVHLPDYTKRRIRFSLKTRNLVEARARRDEILLAWCKSDSLHRQEFLFPLSTGGYWLRCAEHKPLAEAPVQPNSRSKLNPSRLPKPRRQRWV